MKILPILAATAALSGGAMAFDCPGPNNFDAYGDAAARAYDLLGGVAYNVDIGGSTPWSSCGISGNGFLPAKATINMFIKAAEGKQASVQVTSGCSTTHMFVQAGDYRGTASGNPATGTVSVNIPRSYIGNDQFVMVYLSGAAAGEVCQGQVTFRTARG